MIIKTNNKILSAFSLAEMMIVLFIVSIVLISLPPLTKKMFRVKNVKTYHGRYECYLDNNGKLKYYYAKERVGQPPLVEEGELSGNKCEFVPPPTYSYLMIHAVGGGGAGGNITDSTTGAELISYYEEDKPGTYNSWSEWFRIFMDNIDDSTRTKFKIRTTPDAKDVYSAMLTAKYVNLQYRKAGNAGDIVSAFFPFVPAGNKFYLYPGKGGEVKAQNENGADGEPSVVQVIKSGETACDATDSNALCNLIFAKGGRGATVMSGENIISLVNTVQLIGQSHYDFGTSNFSDVKTQISGFNDIIDKVNDSTTSELSSKVPSEVGNGGNGANHYLNKNENGVIYHEFDDFKINPDDDPDMKKGGSQGVEWVKISSFIPANKIPNIKKGDQCENVNASLGSHSGFPDGFWPKRSAIGDISTQCTPDPRKYNYTSKPKYFYCAVGYMKRFFNPDKNADPIKNCYDACDNKSKGPCACYTYEYDGSKYKLLSPVSGNIVISGECEEEEDSQQSQTSSTCNGLYLAKLPNDPSFSAHYLQSGCIVPVQGFEPVIDHDDRDIRAYYEWKGVWTGNYLKGAERACKALGENYELLYQSTHQYLRNGAQSYGCVYGTLNLGSCRPSSTCNIIFADHGGQFITPYYMYSQSKYQNSYFLGSLGTAGMTALCFDRTYFDDSRKCKKINTSYYETGNGSSCPGSVETIPKFNPIHNYHEVFQNKTDISNIYKDPEFNTDSYEGTIRGLFSVKEHIPDNSDHIFCPAFTDSSTTPCASGGEYDSTKGICKASKGGNGAIVILW